MAKNAGSADIRDTNTYTFSKELHTDEDLTFQYINGLDQDVTVTVNVTHEGDTDFSDSFEANSQTVNTDTTDRDTMSYPWDRIQFEVSATTAPTSGTFSIKEMH